jgi:hypothetical protein
MFHHIFVVLLYLCTGKKDKINDSKWRAYYRYCDIDAAFRGCTSPMKGLETNMPNREQIEKKGVGGNGRDTH